MMKWWTRWASTAPDGISDQLEGLLRMMNFSKCDQFSAVSSKSSCHVQFEFVPLWISLSSRQYENRLNSRFFVGEEGWLMPLLVD